MAGTEKFLERITFKVRESLTISKIEKDEYRFTGIDVKKTEAGVIISMEDYANSIEEIAEIGKAKKTEPLSKVETKMYRKYTGKLNWLAENCRPDLAITALMMSRKNNSGGFQYAGPCGVKEDQSCGEED